MWGNKTVVVKQNVVSIIYQSLLKYFLYNLMSLCDCLTDIKSWMVMNFWQLNESKTQVIVFGPSSSFKQLDNNWAPCL